MKKVNKVLAIILLVIFMIMLLVVGCYNVVAAINGLYVLSILEMVVLIFCALFYIALAVLVFNNIRYLWK